MNTTLVRTGRRGRSPWRLLATLLLLVSFLAPAGGLGAGAVARAQDLAESVQFDEGIDPSQWYQDYEIERTWKPGYLKLATGDPSLLVEHGVYAWPFALNSIGWNMQSYQDYGGTPYFHHGIDMMAVNGTDVYNRSGGQVVNVENYTPGNDLYWEVAVLDPDGYIWQYHHIDKNTIPQSIKDKFAEWQADPVHGGFIAPNTYIGDIVYWTVVSFGKRFNHVHLNILGAGSAYINPFEFHTALPDSVGPVILGVGLLQSGSVYSGHEVQGSYSLYVRAKDLVLDDVYYLPPFEVKFSVDGGPTQTTWRFDTLPGGANDEAYLSDYYVVPPTCGDYSCRDYYIDLGFLKDSQYVFPSGGGQHTVLVTVSDYAGNTASQSYTYTVLGPPQGTTVWQDTFESNLGWVRNPNGTDTATLGLWERANPESTDSSGPKQLGTTVSGSYDLVTGPLAGSSSGSYDLDGGVTTMRSPAITLPTGGELTLSFSYYLAHGTNSSTSDYLRVKVAGTTTTTVFEELGGTEDDDAAWALKNVSLNAHAGQTVYLLVEAADASTASLVEAAIDDVLIVTSSTNQPPSADPQSVSTDEDTALGILLTGSDPDNDPLTFSVATGPSHGTLSGTAPSLTYTPAADYNGPDSFAFVVNDGAGSSAPATVSIAVSPVNDAPVANPQSVETEQEQPLSITLTGSDIDGEALTFEVTAGPAHGLLSGTAPNLVYTPEVGYAGPDALAFVAHDAVAASAPAEVTIKVLPINHAPVADPQSVTAAEDVPMGITLTGSDPDGDPLTFSVTASPSHGTLGGTAPDLVYTPAADYYGSDSFSFLVNDGKLNSAPAAVDITVIPVNDAPVANPQSVTTQQDTAVAITLTGSDIDGDPLTFGVAAGPAHGTLSGTAPNLTYTPAAGYSGADSFTFVAEDGQATSAPALVSITVNAAGPLLYLGSSSSGTAGGIAFADEDILVKNQGSGVWAMYIDGSDIGLTNTDVDAYERLPDSSLLLSLDTDFSLSGFGTVDDSDILRFVPTSLGSTTAGTWSWYFDGSDVGLSTADEDVDALHLLPDGRLLISTLGAFSVTGASGQDEDLIAFTPSALGSTTSGTWTLYFDGSDVGLSSTSNEDVNGLWVDAAGKIYLTTLGAFSVTGVSGDGSDIFACTPGSLGNTTTCTWAMYWDGSVNGFSGEDTDSLGVIY